MVHIFWTTIRLWSRFLPNSASLVDYGIVHVWYSLSLFLDDVPFVPHFFFHIAILAFFFRRQFYVNIKNCSGWYGLFWVFPAECWKELTKSIKLCNTDSIIILLDNHNVWLLIRFVISYNRCRVHLHYYLQSCNKGSESWWCDGDCQSYISKNNPTTKWKACCALEDVIFCSTWFRNFDNACYYYCFLQNISFLCSLINLYNLLETPYCRFYVYMKALNLAVDGKVTEYIIPSFKKIDSFLKDWKIGIPEQRELFLTISNILKDNKRYSKKCFPFNFNLIYVSL